MKFTIKKLLLGMAAVMPFDSSWAADAAGGLSPTKTAPQAKVEADIETLVVVGMRKASFTEITEDAVKLVEMPGSLGDPLGAITALPGVITPASGGEPAVRGSSPDDNRYYIDGMPAGYIFHAFNTSIFDENVVQDFQLFSAGFGAQYSQSTGAVFDIRLRDPEIKDLATTVNLSLLRAGLFLEGGLTDSSAFYISARKGLLQYLIPEEDKPNDEGTRVKSAPEDGDYQFKYLWNVDANNKLRVSLAGANDFAEAELTTLSDQVQKSPDLAGDAKFDQQFDSQSINWTNTADDGAEFKLTLASYADARNLNWGEGYFLELGLDSRLLSSQYALPVFEGNTLTLGGEYNAKKHNYSARAVNFVCTEFTVDCDADRRELVKDARELNIAESSLYLIDNWQLTDTFNVEAGLQRSGNDYTQEYFYTPRVAVAWDLLDYLTLTSSAGKYNRPPDIQKILPIVGNPQLKSPQAEHYTFGFKGDLTQYWNWSVETYYKQLTRLPLGLDKSQPDFETLYSNDVEGKVKGVDILLNRNLSDGWYGWMSLSYSESTRTNKRTQETRDYTFDTPIVLNLVANYQLTPKWNTGLRLTTKSGQATTEILGVQENPNFPGRYMPQYGEAYADRLPMYGRLDLRAKRDITLLGKPGTFFIDILNATNKENISERQLDYKKVNATGKLHVKEVADMGILPSIGFSITF